MLAIELVSDAATDTRFRGGESIVRHNIREVICVPMRGRHETVGVLFLELNGCRFIANEEDATQAILELAAGTLDEGAFTRWMRANARPNRA